MTNWTERVRSQEWLSLTLSWWGKWWQSAWESGIGTEGAEFRQKDDGFVFWHSCGFVSYGCANADDGPAARPPRLRAAGECGPEPGGEARLLPAPQAPILALRPPTISPRIPMRTWAGSAFPLGLAARLVGLRPGLCLWACSQSVQKLNLV